MSAPFSTTLTRLAALAAVLASTACIGPFEPQRHEESPARVSLQVRYQHLPGLATGDAATGLLEVGAYLAPGIGDAGRSRRFGSDTLVVRGSRVAPLGVDFFGAREYYVREPLSVADYGAAAIDVALPVIQGITEPVPAVRIPVVTVLSPDTIDVGADSLLRISLSAEALDPSPALVYRAWRVELPGTGAGVAVSGTGAVPSTIVVPASYLTFTDGLASVVLQIYRVAAPVDTPAASSVVVTAEVTEYFRVVARRAP